MAAYKRLSKRDREIQKFQSDMDYAGEATLFFDRSKMRLYAYPAYLFSAKVESIQPMRRKGWYKIDFIGPQPGWSWYGHLSPYNNFVKARKYGMPKWAREMPGYR